MSKITHLHSLLTCHRWTYFWQRGSYTDKIQSWRYELAMSQINEKVHLANVMFDWCHVMETAVECSNQVCQFITFLCCLFYRTYIKTLQIMNKNNLETKCKYKRWILFFWHSSQCERNGSHAKIMWPGRHLLCMRPIAFILWWMSDKWNLFFKSTYTLVPL